jgi:uncharacterized metal-binding protein
MTVEVEVHMGIRAHAEAQFSGPPEAALARAREAALRIPRSGLRSVTDDAFEVTVGITFKSWGEVVRVTALTGEEGTLVRVASRSRLRATLADWGKNRRNVETVLQAL